MLLFHGNNGYVKAPQYNVVNLLCCFSSLLWSSKLTWNRNSVIWSHRTVGSGIFIFCAVYVLLLDMFLFSGIEMGCYVNNFCYNLTHNVALYLAEPVCTWLCQFLHLLKLEKENIPFFCWQCFGYLHNFRFFFEVTLNESHDTRRNLCSFTASYHVIGN